MTVPRALLLLNVLLVLLCGVAHQFASEQYAFVPLVVLGCAFIWWTQSRPGILSVGRRLATALCVGAFLVVILRSLASGDGLRGIQILELQLSAVGDFLILFMWVVLLQDYNPRNFFWFYVVTLALMSVAGLLIPGLAFALVFFLYALLGIAALTVFHMRTELREAASPEAAAETRLPRGLFRRLTVATALLMLPIAGVFAALPRRAGTAPIVPALLGLGVRPVTGFSSTVQLGEMGAIQEDATRIMRVEANDPDTGMPVQPPEILLRGLAHDRYEPDRGRWGWTSSHERSRRTAWTGEVGPMAPFYADTFPGFDTGPYLRIHCNVSMEPLREPVVFVPFAAEQIRMAPPAQAYADYVSQNIRYTRPRRLAQVEYDVISRLYRPAPPGDSRVPPPEEGSLDRFLQLSPEISARVRDLARRVAPDADCPTDYDKAERILAWLSDPARFTYTLDQNPTPRVEPVEDFLFNRQTGHCEYFASAIVVLLRCVGVPARLVTGFKASEYNPIGGYYIVRQSDAHAWAEVYLRPQGWRTYDPSVMRAEATPQPTLLYRWWRNIYDTADGLWFSYVLNYDADIQKELARAISAVGKAVRGIWVSTLMLAGGRTLTLRDRQLWALLTQFVPLFKGVILVAMAGVGVWFAAVAWKGLAGARALRRRRGDAAPYYARMERLLARRGFERQPSQTPDEFAEEIARAGWPAAAPVRAVTAAFCRSRYGGFALSEIDRSEIQRSLEEIRRAPRSASVTERAA